MTAMLPATVQSVFSAVAARLPDAMAIGHSGAAITYRELDRRSSLLALALRTAGVRRGSVVALLLPRSADSLVGLLAILKAGGAYMPLDEAYPLDRLKFMLSDSAATAIVTDSVHGSHPLLASGVPVLRVDQLPAVGAAAPPGEEGAAGDLAYIMYTSGSTGTPKGVEIPHAAILRLVCGSRFAKLEPSVVFLHAAPLGFDASTLEIWGPLLNGGACVVHDELIPTGAGLEKTISRHGVTSAWLTAALFNAIVDDDPRRLNGLKQLLIGGEALSVPHVRRALASLPGTEIINGYGPTETTTFATTYSIPRDLPAGALSIPIGTAIAQTSLYVLGPDMKPVATGEQGELFIGGMGLALGYRGRDVLTRERFVTNRFVGQEPIRLYRTGDLVRMRDDGVVEFVGRVDNQVKIRGYRIEVGEIEAAVVQHESVQNGAVLAREDRPGDKRLVAYVVLKNPERGLNPLRESLAAKLPEFMQPSAYVVLPSFPITANGKLDRRALPAPDMRRPELAQEYRAPSTPQQKQVCELFADVLHLDRAGTNDNFFELGGNSLLALRLLARVREAFGTEISTTTFFQYPTPDTVARHVGGTEAAAVPAVARRPRRQAAAGNSEPVAIIGLAGRFPGANDIDTLWKNLCDGAETVSFFRDDEIDAGVPESLRASPDYVKARGIVSDVESFDAAFFGIGPKEAELMDPQQRKFLEICWECLEHAGYVPDSCPEPVGVFAGMYNATYFQRHVQHRPDLIEKIGEFQVMLANEKDYIATRVAHRLNLTGPAISVHTGCSTSLVAVCQAFDALRNGHCYMALAGGSSITCPPKSGYLYQEGAMLSPDGHTRSFDADAQGTVFSDGAAVVLLKRVSDAIADGDTIYAVIRGVALNNDGAHKASFTAPSADAQETVVALAQSAAGVDPRNVSYIEAHGTATPLGDPIEVAALTRAFRRHTPDVGFCRLGSVKSNFGHVVIAAGATGLIKTALSLKHALIPPSLNYRKPNPKLELDRSPFIVNDRLTEWQAIGPTRLAGVSSFGVGGTNAHVVVEEAPAVTARSTEVKGPYLLALSARNEAALGTAARRLGAFLTGKPGVELRDVAHTLRVGRKAFSQRGIVVAESREQAAAALSSGDASRFMTRAVRNASPDVVFMFPGQGAQYPGMGRGLYDTDPAFRAALDRCAEVLVDELKADLRRLIFEGTAQDLMATAVAQPATFAIEYATAQFWLARGLKPAALIGHSVGEFVAAVLAGVMPLESALRLVARRGRLMQAQPRGSMLSVRAPAEKVAGRLPPNVSIASENSPLITVVAGPTPDIEAFQKLLEADGLGARILQTSHAFHSAMMEPAVAPFRGEVQQVKLSPPQIQIASTLTGQWLTAQQATNPDYWARHLREPVKFSPALRLVAQRTDRVLIEAGPRTTLATLARQHFGAKDAKPDIFSSLGEAPDAEARAALVTLGQLWSCGLDVDLRPLQADEARRVPLPTYPFEPRRYWVDAHVAAPMVARVSVSAPAITVSLAAPVIAAPLPQPIVPEMPMSAVPNAAPPRRERLITQLRGVFEDVAGVDLDDADPGALFVELGIDSLALTQVALQLGKTFGVKVTFRQLMESWPSLDRLAGHLDESMPAEAAPPPAAAAAPVAAAPAAQTAPVVAPTYAAVAFAAPAMPQAVFAGGANLSNNIAPPGAPMPMMQALIEQQMRLMSQQLALLSGASMQPVAYAAPPAPAAVPTAVAAAPVQAVPAPAPAASKAAPAVPAAASATDEEAHTKYDVKKAFGAIARIHAKSSTDLSERQKGVLDAFMKRYIARTQKSKDYTVQHRPHLADPRVVNGFRPQLKEIIYQIVIERSKGPYVWDLDGNKYVDALNGFGMSLFGWQPDFVLDAVRRQLDAGYEIGPQHPLAGVVAKQIAEMTGFDRVGLCNTGSEAVMGCVRIARTVTGRSKIAMFTGAYHGIFDEVIVRGTKKLRAVPAAPGIMPNTAENVLVIDYGTPESLEILRSQANELAAVLIEPVQSRRPDFKPIEFLKELREITRKSGTLFIFDEVVTGFRSHPRGAQHVLGIDADLASYGKVVGAGFPIGVIAGKREYMDALDGGAWQYGDDSIPTVGVTYFAGTFVRHPLVLAAAHAALDHMKKEGPALQERVNSRTTAMVQAMNDFCTEVGAPIAIKSFSSVWKLIFTEDHPLQDVLFAMMRSRGIHILDNFPCFFTTAHAEADFNAILTAFKESVLELQDAEFLPRKAPVPAARLLLDASRPPVPGARLGRDENGKAAWFVPNPEVKGKFLKVDAK